MELNEQATAGMRRLLRHRLLNIASGLKSANSLLARELDDRLTPREREYFPLIQKECDQIEVLVDRFEALLGDLPSVSPALPRSTVSSVVGRFDENHPKAVVDVSFSGESSGRLVCGASLGTILRETLTNAWESSGLPIEVSVCEMENACRISVVDQGTAMTEETRCRAFEPFFSTRARHMGVGLAIVHKLVMGNNGAVSIEPTARGNRVDVVLPYIG